MNISLTILCFNRGNGINNIRFLQCILYMFNSFLLLLSKIPLNVVCLRRMCCGTANVYTCHSNCVFGQAQYTTYHVVFGKADCINQAILKFNLFSKNNSMLLLNSVINLFCDIILSYKIILNIGSKVILYLTNMKGI